MNLDELFADDLFDLPVPAGAITAVHRRSSRMRQRRRVLMTVPVVLAGAVLATLAVGGTGGAKTAKLATDPSASPTPPPLPYQQPSAATTMFCVEEDTHGAVDLSAGVSGERLITGDPVADCARYGRERGFDAPLAAYSDGSVYLTVVPASWKIPATYRRLRADFRVDDRRLAASLMLEDPIDGVDVSSTPRLCRTEEQARGRARELLDQAGLHYDIKRDDSTPKPNGVTICAWAILSNEDTQTVLLEGHDITLDPSESLSPSPGPGSELAGQIQRFIGELRTRIAERCLNLGQAQQQVVEAAAVSGLSPAHYETLPTTVAGDRCTRIDIQVAGARLPVILRHAS